MLSMLIAYDAARNVIGTLDFMVTKDANGDVVGLVDFDAHELAGGAMTDVWIVEGAAGSKTWPEWIGSRAHDFRVELDGPPGSKRIVALVHKTSNHRRERMVVGAAITQRIAKAKDEPVDIRDLVGGPDRPLHLDDNGRTATRPMVMPALPLLKPER